MSRNILNLGLLVIVAVLAAVLIWEPGQQQDIVSKLSPLQTDNINSIHIQRDSLQDVHLEKQHGSWKMLIPYLAAADETRVNALLSLLNTTSYARFSGAGRKLSAYGLEPSLAQVTFNDSLFQFGSLEHISKRRYVLSPDNEIHLATDLFYHQLRTSASQFVSPRLFTDTQRITRLLSGTHQYEQQHDGSWLVTPGTGALPADKLNAHIDNWQRLRASRISPASKAGSDEKIRVELADGTGLLFELLRNDEEVIFIRRDIGLQYHVSLQVAEAVLTSPQTNTPQQQ